MKLYSTTGKPPQHIKQKRTCSQKMTKKINYKQLNQIFMKKIFLIFALLSITTIAMCQFKVNSSGRASIGKKTNATNSMLLISDSYSSNNEITIKVANPSIEIAAWDPSQTTTQIKFWHSTAGWNELMAKKYIKSSDRNLKTEICPILNATNILKQLKTYSYYYISDSLETRKKNYGVMAQEVEEILPDIVDTAKGTYGVSYDDFVAFLIAGFNEQQTVIETQQREITTIQNIILSQELQLIELSLLQNQIDDLKKKISDCCDLQDMPMLSPPQNLQQQQAHQPPAILYQNTPNPFSVNTEILCDVPEMINNAFIYVYNLQGVELRTFSLTQGFNTVKIYASELSAGMYLYTLVVDNQIIDSKRMILTK